MGNLAVFLASNDKVGEAEFVFRSALAECSRKLGADSSIALSYMDDLAILLEGAGRAKEAEVLFRRAFASRQRTLGDKHEDTLRSMNNLAVLLDNEGQGEVVLNLYRRVLEGRIEVLGESHTKSLESSYNLAVCLADQGCRDEAVSHLTRLVGFLEKDEGPHKDWVFSCFAKLGEIYKEMGQLKAAENMFRRVHEAAALPDTEPESAGDAAYNLAICLSQQGLHSDAEPLYKAAVESYVLAFSRDDVYTLDAAFNLAVCVEAQGRLKEAEQLYVVSVHGREGTLGSDHEDTQLARAALESCRASMGKPMQACTKGTKSPGQCLTPNNFVLHGSGQRQGVSPASSKNSTGRGCRSGRCEDFLRAVEVASPARGELAGAAFALQSTRG